MDKKEKTVVVGTGVKVSPGSEKLECAKCGRDVWVTPYGQRIIKEKNAEAWCLSCFTRYAPITAEIMPIAEEQLDEMEKVLGYRPSREELMGLIHHVLNDRYSRSDLA